MKEIIDKHEAGRWRVVNVYLDWGGMFSVNVPNAKNESIDALLRIPGFGGIKYRSPENGDVTSFLMAPPNAIAGSGPWDPLSARFWVQE